MSIKKSKKFAGGREIKKQLYKQRGPRKTTDSLVVPKAVARAHEAAIDMASFADDVTEDLDFTMSSFFFDGDSIRKIAAIEGQMSAAQRKKVAKLRIEALRALIHINSIAAIYEDVAEKLESKYPGLY